MALLLITTGVTLAFFTYSATGETINTITVGGITFHYREMQGKGHGISIKDALPVSDNDDGGLGGGAIFGLIVANLFVLGLICFCCSKCNENNNDNICIVAIFSSEWNLENIYYDDFFYL